MAQTFNPLEEYNMKAQTFNISLIASGRTKGVSYTPAELALAKAIVAIAFTAAGFGDYETHCKDEAVVAAVNELGLKMTAEVAEINKTRPADKQQQISLSALCRAAYRQVEAARHNDPATVADFPKEKGRDHTSLTLLFRSGLKEIGIPAATMDAAFPSPYKKLKAS